MARVSAHGAEIGTVNFTTTAKRYMSDGTILKNSGFGWKLAGKLKSMTPQEAYAGQLAKQKEFEASHPLTAAYRRALHDMAGLGKRWKLHAAVRLMPDDADGVWSEACDGYGDNVHADIDEVSSLCRAYKLAVAECQDIKSAKLES